MNRLLVVANRLPVQFKNKNATVQIVPSSGGLVSSMISYRSHSSAPSQKAPWIAAPDISEKKYSTLDSTALETDYFSLQPVFLLAAIKNGFYQGFCNDCLWPLFHYFPSYAKFLENYFNAYQKANQIFSDAVITSYQPGDTNGYMQYFLRSVQRLTHYAASRRYLYTTYRVVAADGASELLSELSLLAVHAGFEVIENTMVVEARCAGVNKGLAVKKLLSSDHDFVLAMGDARNDEDLFNALPQSAYSIRVGLTQRRARYNFKHQSHVLPFLNRLIPAYSEL